MANNGGEDSPLFKKGEALSASKLNRLAQTILKKILASAPLKVTTTAGGVMISFDEKLPRNWKAVVPAKIATVVGGGAFTVDTYEAGYLNPVGRAAIPATAVDDTFAPSVGDKVTVFFTRTAAYIISASGGGGGGGDFKPYMITANHGDGSYSGIEIDHPGGSAVTSTTLTNLKENNGSKYVDPGQSVIGKLYADGHIWFDMPLGNC